MFVGEWPREHAKSVVMDISCQCTLGFGKLTGVVLSSANEDKADGLLADLQEQLMFNQRYIADYGPQYKSGNGTPGISSRMTGSVFGHSVADNPRVAYVKPRSVPT